MKALSAFALAAWACLLPVARAGAQSSTEPARAIIVFDASGSMWGEVPGGAKIDIAKKAVSDIVTSLDPALEIGLIAYGHRSKGDCEDIELLVPPQRGGAAAILKAVAALQPKGKTPLTHAVLQAASHLKYTEAKASVILVSDGVETCGRDPCTAADELERLGVDFACHVIGFDLKPGESSGLECLASKTGGIYLPAKDAVTLTESLQVVMKQVIRPDTALVVEPKRASGGPVISGVAFQLFAPGSDENAIAAGTGGRWLVKLEKPGKYTISAKLEGKTVEVEADVKEGETATREVVFAETGVKAVAYDTEGGKAFTSGVSWDLLGTADAEGKRPQVAYSFDAQPFLKVAPGKFLLRAKRGNATGEMELEVGNGPPATVKLIIGSGVLKLSAIATEGGEPIAKGLGWEVLGAPNAEGVRPRLAFSYDAQPTFTLPPGPCLVTVEYGNASGKAETEVIAGKTQMVTVSLGSGKLQLSAAMDETGDSLTKNVAWDIFGQADSEGNRRKAGYSYDAQPVFNLPAGSYQVAVQVGNAKAIVEATVEAGKTTTQKVILGAGKVALQALPIEGAEPLKSEVSWDVFGAPDAEGNRPKAGYSYEASPTLSLPSGTYRVEVNWGRSSAAKDVTVQAGKLVNMPVILNAGTLVLSALMAEGADPAATNVAWDVLSEPNAEGERRKAAYSYEAQPKFRLNAGKYLVQVARGRSATAEAEVEVTAGKTLTRALVLNAGTVKLNSTGSGGWEIHSAPDGEGNRKTLFYSYEAQATAYIPAGKVLVIRTVNQKRAEKEIEVKPNKLTELTLNAE